MQLNSERTFEEFPVTDYDLAVLGTTIALTVKDGIDVVERLNADDPTNELGVLVLVITTVEPAQRNIFPISQLLGLRITHRMHRKLVAPSHPASRE